MQLMECPAEDDYVTSVAWAADGKHVSVGTSSAQVQVGLRSHSLHITSHPLWHQAEIALPVFQEACPADFSAASGICQHCPLSGLCLSLPLAVPS